MAGLFRWLGYISLTVGAITWLVWLAQTSSNPLATAALMWSAVGAVSSGLALLAIGYVLGDLRAIRNALERQAPATTTEG